MMPIIVSTCQHCDEQQFQTLSCVHYTIFLVVKLDLFIRALLLDRILPLEKTTRTPLVHLVSNRMRFLPGVARIKVSSRYTSKHTKLLHFNQFHDGACPKTPITKTWRYI